MEEIKHLKGHSQLFPGPIEKHSKHLRNELSKITFLSVQLLKTHIDRIAWPPNCPFSKKIQNFIQRNNV